MDAIFYPELLTWLPAQSREKIAILEDRRSDSYGALRLALADMDEARDRRDRLEVEIRQREVRHDTGGVGSRVRVSPDELAVIRAPLDRLEASIAERLRPRHDRAVSVWKGFDFLGGVAVWASDAKRSGLRLRHSPLPTLKGADFRKIVTDARARLAGLDVEWTRIESSPRPIADARATIIDEVDRIAELGRPDIDLRIRDRSPIDIRRLFGIVGQGNSAAALSHAVVWAARDLIADKVLALLPKNDPADALSDDERDREFERLSAARLEAERIEESAIVAANAIGLTISRRNDVDPRTILEVEEA